MKKFFTFFVLLFGTLSFMQAQTFTDDFESYTAGVKLGTQSPDWRTWSGAGGGSDDALVVTTDNHTTDGTKSVYFSSTSSNGGPQDVVLPFTATTALTTGQFSFSTWFKIPAGKTAYFNFQGNSTIGNAYALDCFMETDGTISIQNSGTEVASSTHPSGTWFKLTINANFNSNSWELLIDDVSQATWSNTINQVWGIDYYPADASASFWIDDVSYDVTPYVLPELNAAGSLFDISNGLTGQTRYAEITVRNLGTTTITSFDLSLTQNGGTPILENVTGQSVASLASVTIPIATPFVLIEGANVFEATISNVNELGADGDNTDDVVSKTINAITPAVGKKVVAEEATGTWCGWCPRGAVYMDAMAAKYEDYFIGIAVHHNDPMEVTEYDAAIENLIPGYPSALVDRISDIDPGAIETDLLTRIVESPKAVVINGANYDSGTRILQVSVTSTIQSDITGNYTIACVITEDDVTGTTSAYNQANYYSGGDYGEMGGFELLANPVPAAQMHYNFVARFISPSFAGVDNATGTSASTGDIFTYNFSFTLPAGYDETQIHIIGLFIDPTGKIDNAGSATITEAVENGYIPGIGVGVNEIVSGPDAQISLFPNPSADFSTISLNLTKSSSVLVKIVSIDGAIVAKKDYGDLNGSMTLPVDLSKLNSGMYFINVTIDGNATALKLIKK